MSAVTYQDWRPTLSEMRARLVDAPDTHMSAEFQARAGLGLRRDVRALIARARMRGATAEADEQKGLLDSLFTIRLEGTVRQLAPILEMFAELEAL